MSRRVLYLLFAVAALGTQLAAAEIYKCRVDGKLVFTDEPCAGETVELKNMNRLPAVEEIPAYAEKARVYDSGEWFYGAGGYASALRTSARFNTPIFIYFQADWCGYCRKLEKELLQTSAAKNVMRQIIKVELTPDNSAEERRLFDQMGGTGYPTVLIQQSPDSKPRKRSLMRKKFGKWRTLSVDDLEQMIASAWPAS